MDDFLRKCLALALLVSLTGCASNKALRPDPTVCQLTGQPEQCGQHALLVNAAQSNEQFRLGFIEIDDQGQVRDRQQLTAVIDSFREIAGSQDVLLVGFVHGWHHNARYDDDNVQKFSHLLSKLAKAESQGNHRKVLGVYLGWRGESVLPPLSYFTFWERKNTAQKVGANGVTEVFLKLEEIVNVREGQVANGKAPGSTSRLVLIGHSFGGAVVFNALEQILEDRFIDSRRGKTASDTAKGFGNLVVLVNPAFEALRYASLYDLSRERCSYFPEQLPRLAILTSEADWATKLAFPAGRFFSTVFETHNTIQRDYCPSTRWAEKMKFEEGQADRRSVGHFEPFLTHELRALDQETKETDATPVASRSFEVLLQNWATQQPSERLVLGDVELIHLGKAHPRNPYLNIRVDRKLIPDHNEIWGDRVERFIRDLIILSASPESKSP